MAGILANSASVTMVSGDTSTDNTFAGFISQEQVTLSTSPTGSSYSWGLGKPSGSTDRALLSSKTSASPVFTPDVAGTYTITCDVDGTEYVLRITVTASAITSVANAHRCSPITDASVPTPAKGQTLFCSSDYSEGWSARDEDGNVHRVGWQRKGVNLADADAAVTMTGGEYRVLPASTLTTGRTLTLGTGGARVGSELTVKRLDTTANTLAVVNGGAGGGTLFTFAVGVAGWADFYFDGTDWELKRESAFS